MEEALLTIPESPPTLERQNACDFKKNDEEHDQMNPPTPFDPDDQQNPPTPFDPDDYLVRMAEDLGFC